MAQVLVVRTSGELGTKATQTRRRMSQRLVRNLKDSLDSAGLQARVERTYDRIYVHCDDAEAAAAASERVFGVQSLSIALPRSWRTLDDLVAAGVEIFSDAVRERRFAVRVRRIGDRSVIPVTSKDLERELGTALLPDSAGVDLRDPEVSAHLELTAESAYLFVETRRGHGGLPVGVSGRAISLISGGFDSAVASWQLLRRGVAVDYAFCNLGGLDHQLGTLRVAKLLADHWSYGTRPRFHTIDFDLLARDIRENSDQRYWQILLKRLMLRAGEAVASDRGASALITGEAVGQVSSQTLPNLQAISLATRLPILRPLVGSNKDEIVAAARRIGTFDLSAQVDEYCAMVPRKPATRAGASTIDREEARLDPELLERAIAERSVFDLRTLDLGAFEDRSLETSEIPEDAIVIDLRSKVAFEGWHWRDALFLDFGNALRAYPHFDRKRQYVLYCEFGLKSAHLAELMRRDGFEAHHFAGGLRTLWRHAAERGHPLPDTP